MLNSLILLSRDCWGLLNRRGRVILVTYSCSLMLTAVLDGTALLLFSRLGKELHFSERVMDQDLMLGIVCVILFLAKSGTAVGITWLGYSQFARQEVLIGQENYRKYMAMDPGVISDELQSSIYGAVDRGPAGVTQGVLLPVATLLAELVNALALFGILVFLDPITALTGAGYFLIVSMIQHRALSLTASHAGQVVLSDLNATYDVLSDAKNLAKTLRVMPSRTVEGYLNDHRQRLADSRAKVSFLESLPRFFMESVVALGLVVISLVTILVRGLDELTAALAVFGVAGFRLLPIINRIQGIILGLLGREPIARLGLREFFPTDFERKESYILDESVVLQMSEVRYVYPGSEKFVLDGVSINFQQGKTYAIAGISGSGKSTLLNLCMGVIKPTSGVIEWNGSTDNRIAYVPQETVITSCGLYGNVALEWNEDFVDRLRAEDSLRQASLGFVIDNDRFSEKDFLSGLSGGQKQRLGLARAFYRNPTVLFLDEPTSALDLKTEYDIMQSISDLRGSVTVVIVAHRLSTIQNADIVIFIDEGRVLGSGSFSELRFKVPEFNHHVELGRLADN